MCFWYSKTCVKRSLSKRSKIIFKTNYRLMQVKKYCRMLQEHSAMLLTFIKLPFVITIPVLSIFKWPFYTGFTVCKLLFWANRKTVVAFLFFLILFMGFLSTRVKVQNFIKS